MKNDILIPFIDIEEELTPMDAKYWETVNEPTIEEQWREIFRNGFDEKAVIS